MKGLKEDHKEIIRQLLDSEGWEAILAVAALAVKKQERNVLECDISKPRELLIKRANLDGARTVELTLRTIKSEFKSK